VVFDGAPTAVSAAAFQLTVPGSRLSYGTDIVVFANADARFDIRDGLVFEDDPAYDIPASEAGVAIDPVTLAGGVSGGVLPYRFAAAGLPAGLAIDELTGVISGTPTAVTAAGSATVTVADALDYARSITIDFGAVTAAGGPPDDPITTPLAFTDNAAFDIPASKVGTAITPIALAGGVSGGALPYRFSATGLPAGLVIDEQTGVISGTPTAVAAAGSATITVTDDENSSQSITISYGAVTAADAGTQPGTTQPGTQPGTTAAKTGDTAALPMLLTAGLALVAGLSLLLASGRIRRSRRSWQHL